MSATSTKQKVLAKVLKAPRKRSSGNEQEARPVLEEFIYGICLENTTPEQADRAFRKLREQFIDWNEIRVSSAREVEEALRGLPNAEQRAERVIGFLQQVFDEYFSFKIDDLDKKKGGVKQATKQLSDYVSASPAVVSWVVQRSLGGHALPLDDSTFRTTQRLGLVECDQQDRSSAQSSLEHLVPKAKGLSFTEQINYIAHEYCYEEDPACKKCPMAKECPTGQERASKK